MTFGSPTASDEVNFTNSIDLNGEIRQFDVAAGLGGDSVLISGNIIDSALAGGGLLKTGAGILILSGSNSYKGGATISGGTLAVTSANGLGAASGTLSIGAATLEISGSFADGRNIDLTDHRRSDPGRCRPDLRQRRRHFRRGCVKRDWERHARAQSQRAGKQLERWNECCRRHAIRRDHGLAAGLQRGEPGERRGRGRSSRADGQRHNWLERERDR